MANRLTTLLKTPTLTRTVADYEEVFDDFVRFARGHRLSECTTIPSGHRNADYYFEFDTVEIILELKQVNAYQASRTVEEYVAQLLKKGRVSHVQKLPDGEVRITRASLSPAEWSRFYERFRPRIPDHLKKAAAQLKSTHDFLGEPRRRRVQGVMFVNTGDFNLPTDLMFDLVHWKLDREWKRGHWSSIDFARCHAIDMSREGQHPFYARQIVRTTADPTLVNAVHYLYERWLHYAADAFGMRVEFQEGAVANEIVPGLSQRFRGKIRMQSGQQ